MEFSKQRFWNYGKQDKHNCWSGKNFAYLFKFPMNRGRQLLKMKYSSVMSNHIKCKIQSRKDGCHTQRPLLHNDVIKWNHFPCYWPFMWGIHWSLVNSPHKGQWRGALVFSLICAWTNGWANNRDAGDLTRHHVHYDVTVMLTWCNWD